MKNPNLNENVANEVQRFDLASVGLNGNAVVVNAADLDNGDVLRLPFGSYLLLNVDSPLNVSARITDGNAVLISLPDGRFFTVKLEGEVLASGEIPIYIQQDSFGATSAQAMQLYQFDAFGGQGDLQVVTFSRSGSSNNQVLNSLAGDGSGGDAGFNALASTGPGGSDGLNSLVGGGLGLGSNALISGDGSLSGAIGASGVGSGGSAIAGSVGGPSAGGGSSATSGNSSGSSDDSISAQQIVFNAALDTVQNYAETNGAGDAPGLATYETLNINGVTAANFGDFNIVVARKSGSDVDSQGEIQTIANSFVRILAEAGDTDGTNPDPTADDFVNVGLPSLTPDEVALLNSLIVVQDAGSFDVDTLDSLILGMQAVAAALDTVENYAETSGASDAPDMTTYQTLTVDSVTAANLADLNIIIARKAGNEVDTLEEIHAVADSFGLILAEAGDTTGANPDPTADDFANVGLSLTADEVALLNSAIRDQGAGNLDVATLDSLAAIAQALSAIINYAEADGAGDAPELAAYGTLGINDVTAANLDDINTVIARKAGSEVDTQEEIQAVASSLGRIQAEAGDTAGDNVDPTADDFANVGLSLTPDEIALLNSAIRDVDAGGLDAVTLYNLAAIAQRDAAFARIQAEAGDTDVDGGDNVDPTAEDFAKVGFTLTADGVALLNSAIRDQAAGSLDEAVLNTLALATQGVMAVAEAGIGNDHDVWWGNNATQMYDDLAALGIDVDALGVDMDTIPGILVDLAQAGASDVNTVDKLTDFIVNQSIGVDGDGNSYTDSLVKAYTYTITGGATDALEASDFENLGITQLAGNDQEIDTVNALLARENLGLHNMGGAYKIKALIDGYQDTDGGNNLDLQASNVDGVDVLVGDDNDNVLTLNAGRDIAFGGGGNDTFNVTADVVSDFGLAATQFLGTSVIDGGDGTDTLKLDAAAAVVLDFTQIDDSIVKNIETIDIGLHDIILATEDVLAMTDADNELTIDLVSGGAVNLQGGFQQQASSSKAGYLEFTSGNATVFVNDDIAAGDLVVS